MKSNYNWLTAAILCIVFSGCATHEKILVNDTGGRYKCASKGYGLIGVPMAKNNFDECIAQANNKGYK